jgi:hypothetical protein
VYDAIDNLQPGVTEIHVQPAADTPELAAETDDAVATGAVPGFELDFLQILHEKRLGHGNSFTELPLLIVRDVIHYVFDLHRGFSHCFPPILLGKHLSNTAGKSKIAGVRSMGSCDPPLLQKRSGCT